MDDNNDDPKLDLTNIAALAAFANGDLGNALVASTSGGIEKQEALGQKAVLNSDVLPITLQGITKDELRAFGFEFGRLVDDLFQEVRLPAGWIKRPAPDHSMWSYLYDAKGEQRAAIFYKAAFYDRKAFFSWSDHPK